MRLRRAVLEGQWRQNSSHESWLDRDFTIYKANRYADMHFGTSPIYTPNVQVERMCSGRLLDAQKLRILYTWSLFLKT